MRALILALTLLVATPALAEPAPERQVEAVSQAVGTGGSMPALVARVAEQFLGVPYGAQGWSEADQLASRLNAFDCVTLVETSLAIARAVARQAPGSYPRELMTLRFRDGKPDGFASRLHYFSDWIADNERRGHLRDITRELGGEADARKIHYMTSHWESYQKVKVQADYDAIAAVETAMNARARYVLPKARVAEVLDRLETGDIVAMATNIEGLDVVHVGLVYRKPDGAVHLLHAPVPGDVVCVSRKALPDYLKTFDAHVGVIVARPLAPAAPGHWADFLKPLWQWAVPR